MSEASMGSRQGSLGRWIRLLTCPEAVVVLLLPLAWFISHRASPYFTGAYMMSSSSLYAETGIMALGMTLIIISGNIDLSVASNLCLTGVVCAELYDKQMVSMPVAILLAPIIGGVLGLFNGVLIAAFRLPSLTVTLGTMALYRGLAQVMVGDEHISSFPSWFIGINKKYVVGQVPAPLGIFVGLAVVFGLLLAKTTFGRRVYAIGTNESAARFAGIRVTFYKLLLFTISGVLSGLCAMIMLSRLPSASYTMAHDETCSELAVITAVVLGGTDIFGGRGTIFGTVMALFLLAVVSRGMGVANVLPTNQLAVTGALLVGAVILFRLLRAATTRR